jgi:hypothetical protein
MELAGRLDAGEDFHFVYPGFELVSVKETFDSLTLALSRMGEGMAVIAFGVIKSPRDLKPEIFSTLPLPLCIDRRQG